ncbi:MAG: RNA methyltransferase [Bacteroides sp.]|jgi:TrmH family RNA methyltransferase|nr:RNA methyltransferase [Bacteroides sp.]
MRTHISSLQNPLVKSLVKLQQKANERKSTGTFLVEGRREVSLALRHGIVVEKLIVCPELYVPDPNYPIDIKSLDDNLIFEVSDSVYRKIAYREGVEGILMLGKGQPLHLEDYKPSENPLIIILEGVEKPGNLGAILRTTDAAGVEAIFFCDSRTDLYNPNAIRASLGCVFSQTIVECSSKQAIEWLKERGIPYYSSSPDTAHLYFDVDFSEPAAIAFGAEDKGLSKDWLKEADRVIRIPMGGIIDSLNVSASVAIVTFEAVRQRRINPRPN